MQGYMIYFTVPNLNETNKIVDHLIAKYYVSCANIITNVVSVYKWTNKLARDKEILVICKTTKDTKMVIKEIKNLHSYTTPCITAYNMSDVDNDYLKWMNNN